MSTRVESKIKTIQAALLSLESTLSRDNSKVIKEELENSSLGKTAEESFDGPHSDVEQLEAALLQKDRIINELVASQAHLLKEVERWQRLAQQAPNSQRCQDCYKEVNEVKHLLHSIEAKNSSLKEELARVVAVVAAKDQALAAVTKHNAKLAHSLDHCKRRHSKLQQRLFKLSSSESSSEAFGVLQSYCTLVQQLGQTLVELSPPGAFQAEAPSPSHILTYFSNLLSQYMELKVSVDGRILSQLSTLIGVAPSQLVHHVEKFVVC